MPHVPCNNHLLSSEVEAMVTTSRELGTNLGMDDIVYRVNQTMSEAKGSMKNAAVLRGLTYLCHLPLNGITWSTKATLFKKRLTGLGGNQIKLRG